MLEDVFKAQFIASFCAAWCANNFKDAWQSGEYGRLEKPPIEDAKYLANCAWQEWLKINR